MTPKQIDGDWYVFIGDEQVGGPFTSNSQAWRWIDGKAGEPVSKNEESWMRLRKSNGGVE